MAAIVDDPTVDVTTALTDFNVVANDILADQLAQIEPAAE